MARRVLPLPSNETTNPERHMNQKREPDPPRGRLGSVLGDVQFWIPVVVLAGGLGVLWWIH
jgi:hypothetical protein